MIILNWFNSQYVTLNSTNSNSGTDTVIVLLLVLVQ